MALRRVAVSVSQLCELLGVEVTRFRGLEAPKARVTAEGGMVYDGALHILVEDSHADNGHDAAAGGEQHQKGRR